MAPKITLLSDVRPGKTDFKIKARVIRLWKVADRNNATVIRSIEVILLDEKSSRIQASVNANLFSQFESVLEEGCCYIIHNVLVAQKDQKFCGARHDFKLTFMRNTMCMKTECSSIPLNHFDFVSFSTIQLGVDDGFLIDVIGHVVSRTDVRDSNKNGSTKRILEITLEDLLGEKLECTLWDDFAEQVNSYLLVNDADSMVVLVLQLCKMRLFKGNVGISNSFDATKVFINADLDEIVAYKNRLQSADSGVTHVVSHVSDSNSKSITDDFLKGHRFTVLDIIEMDKASSGVVFAKIIEFDYSKGWYYQGCSKCFRKVTDRVGRLFYCSHCALIVPSVRRIKIHVQVIDSTGSACFTLFDRVATLYLEESIDKILEEDKGDEVSDWPSAFEVLLEKEMLFKVNISNINIEKGWTTYAVKRCSADPAVIDEFKLLHGIKEDVDDERDSANATQVDDNLKVLLEKTAADFGDSNYVDDPINIVDDDVVPNGPNTPSTKSTRKRLGVSLGEEASNEFAEFQSSSSKHLKFVAVKIEKP